MITLTIEGNTLAEVLAQVNALVPGAVDAVMQEPQLVQAAQPSAPVATYAPPAAIASATSAAPTPSPVTAPAAPAVSPSPPPAAPVQTPTYTADDLMRAAGTLMDAGKGSQLQQLMVQMGVAHFGQLTPDRYGEFALAIKGMGAKL